MSAERQENAAAAEAVLRQVTATEDPLVIGSQLFAVADLLASNRGLLRALTDTGRDSADRVSLAADLLAKHCSAGTESVVGELVGRHWTDPEVLISELGQLGAQAILLGAQKAGALRQVQSELLAVVALLADNRDLRIQLSELGAGNAESRSQLAGQILGDSVLPETRELVERAVRVSEHGRLLQALRSYGAMSADLDGAQLVTITAAAPLSGAQLVRMKGLVQKQLGTPVALAVAVDQSLVGGFRINYGQQAVDASVRAEIAEAKRALTR